MQKNEVSQDNSLSIVNDKPAVNLKRVIEANKAVLGQLMDFLSSIDESSFTFEDPAFPGSIGAHVRHILDHVAAVTEAEGVIDYDDRQRGTSVENSLQSARKAIESLTNDLLACSNREDNVVYVVQAICADDLADQSPRVPSSLCRELTFVLSHTVHHMAIIRMLAVQQGITAPQDFGFAPSTLQFLQRS